MKYHLIEVMGDSAYTTRTVTIACNELVLCDDDFQKLYADGVQIHFDGDVHIERSQDEKFDWMK